jgi:FtsP/CotA-like multicopper oxidase with cupredoxin domain
MSYAGEEMNVSQEDATAKQGFRMSRRALGLATLAGTALGSSARLGRGGGYSSVPIPETPNGSTLVPQADADGVRRVTLTAEQVNQVLLDYQGKQVVAQAYGFNGGSPGPTLVFYEGDQVAITVINNLPEPTAIHWHGVIVPNSQDGVREIGEPTPLIQPGDSYTYRYRIVQSPGTHMYHSHVDIKSEMLGLIGGFIILPAHPGDDTHGDDTYDDDRHGEDQHYNRDVVYWLHEWNLPQDLMGMALKDRPYTGSPVDTVNSVTAEPNWFTNELNFFTMNGKCYPSTTPLQLQLGQKMRVRFFNIGLNTHPMHLHGQNFLHIAEDGVDLKRPQEMNTIPVSVGNTEDILITAQNPGIWPLHCHVAHHQANNLSSGFGGMATVLKIS